MPEWRVPINWEMSAILHIEADTLAEALEMAYDPDIEIPDDGEYMDDSWHVPDIGIDEIRDWYNDGQEDGGAEPEPEQTGTYETSNTFTFVYNYDAPSELRIGGCDEKEDEHNPDELFGFLFCDGKTDGSNGG